MINLNELLKELKSNKEIEFERLKKEFIKDDVIIELGNCEKSFVEEWYIAMAGQKFAGQNWKTGEDWKYTIEDFPQVAKVLAQNEHTNKDTIQYILFFAKGLEKDDNTKSLGYSIQDLVFAHPVFPEARYDIFEGGADFYESMAGSLAILPAMLKNPNYPSDALLMVMNEVEPVDSKTEAILNTVLKHENFDTQPLKIENEISKSYAEQFYVDGHYKIIEDIVLLLNCSFDKVQQNMDFKTITTKSGVQLEDAWRFYTIENAPIEIFVDKKEDAKNIIEGEDFRMEFDLDELIRKKIGRSEQMEKDTLESLENLQSQPNNLSLNIIAEIIGGDDGGNYEEEVKESVVGGGELWENSSKDFDSPPFESYSLEKLGNVFDGSYLKIEGTVQEVRMTVNGEDFEFEYMDLDKASDELQ
tara:strand:- start:94 stop:1338 length:1245 start_codon:yes stop_codon:yes gene_type:complete